MNVRISLGCGVASAPIARVLDEKATLALCFANFFQPNIKAKIDVFDKNAELVA